METCNKQSNYSDGMHANLTGGYTQIFLKNVMKVVRGFHKIQGREQTMSKNLPIASIPTHYIETNVQFVIFICVFYGILSLSDFAHVL